MSNKRYVVRIVSTNPQTLIKGISNTMYLSANSTYILTDQILDARFYKSQKHAKCAATSRYGRTCYANTTNTISIVQVEVNVAQVVERMENSTIQYTREYKEG